MTISKIIRFFCLSSLLLLGCNHELIETPEATDQEFTVVGQTIYKQSESFSGNGVNTLNTFGVSNEDLISVWKIKIVREFIGNLREQPIEGFAVQDAAGSFLHALQNIVDSNRLNDVVTILCPFGWVDDQGNQTLFTGLNPSSQPFYDAYKDKMQAIAKHFKNQPDVWIEVWNEPYHFNNENGYSHDLWLNDHVDMVENLRAVVGFNNIIVVPGNEQGQSEEAILEKGSQLLNNRSNIVFDIHAYENWLLNTTKTDIEGRINQINNNDFAFIFGEVGVINSSGLMHVDTFLETVKETATITLAWLFNRNSEDQNSLLTDSGEPNNINNNSWGDTFKNFLLN